MKTIIENVILSGNYKLETMLDKIKICWIEGDLTDEEKDGLIALAQTHARPENSYAPVQEQIDAIFDRLAEIDATIQANAQGMSALKDALEQLGGTVTPGEPQPADEWPEWKAWDGIGKIPWQLGSQCTHNGVRYISKVADNIWEPGAYGVDDTVWEKQEN